MKEEKVKENNLLNFIPKKNENTPVQTDSQGRIVLVRENTGFYNRIAQKLFARPRLSYIHLDGIGNFIWPLMDGNTTVQQLAEQVKDRFGKEAEPLYERLIKYLQILSGYGFITMCAPEQGGGTENPAENPPETQQGNTHAATRV